MTLLAIPRKHLNSVGYMAMGGGLQVSRSDNRYKIAIIEMLHKSSESNCKQYGVIFLMLPVKFVSQSQQKIHICIVHGKDRQWQ